MLNDKKEEVVKERIGARYLCVAFFCSVQFGLFADKLIIYQNIKTPALMLSLMLALVTTILLLKIGKMKVSHFALIIMSLLICYVSYKITDNMRMLYIPLTIPFLMLYEIKDIAKFDAVSKISIILIVFTFYLLGLTTEEAILRGNDLRMSFGFRHPNTLGYILVTLLIDLLIFCKSNKKRKSIIIAYVIIASVLLMMADSRTSIVALIGILMINAFHPKIRIKKAAIKRLCKTIAVLAPVLMTILSIVFTNMYRSGNESIKKMDEVMNGRIGMQAYYMDKSNVTIFGQKMDFSVLPLDNSYYNILLNFGMSGLALMILMYSLSIKRALDEKDFRLLGFLVLLSIFAIMENSPTRIAATPIVLYAFTKKGDR